MCTPGGTAAIIHFFSLQHHSVFAGGIDCGEEAGGWPLMEALREEAVDVPAASFQPHEENERHGLVMNEDDHVETFSSRSSSE